MVEQGFALSEASSTPVMLELRIRACHVHGSFVAKDNRAPLLSRNNPHRDAEIRLRARSPAALDLRAREASRSMCACLLRAASSREHRLNELFAGEQEDIGIIVPGRAVQHRSCAPCNGSGLADAFGKPRIPIYVLNVTYPLVPTRSTRVLRRQARRAGGRGGQSQLHRAGDQTDAAQRRIQHAVHGKDVLPLAGEYTGEVVLDGLAKFLAGGPAGSALTRRATACRRLIGAQAAHAARGSASLCPRGRRASASVAPSGRCSARIKLAEREIGQDAHRRPTSAATSFATLPPFNLGNTMLGYGLALAPARQWIAPICKRRLISDHGRRRLLAQRAHQRHHQSRCSTAATAS